jgi:YHS domain-containing protein
MKARLLTLVLVGLTACEAKRASAPPDPRQAETPLLAKTAPDTPQAEKPLVSAPAPVTPSADAQQNRLFLVQERSQVCMVNDQYMGREQIPVTIAEKTYYGCCPMCKGRLERDPAARAANDPVTGTAVDKATAIIGRAPSGQVFYFESEDTLRQYKL